MVLVFLADGFEESEAVVPTDYLRRAGFNVKTVGVRGKLVRSAHGVSVIADLTMFDVAVEEVEMIVLPGGMPGTTNLEKSQLLQKLIRHCMDKNITVGAICAAPTVLGHLGLLEGRTVTCYPGYEDELTGAHCTGSACETDGNLVTSRGPATAQQFAFALVEKEKGKACVDQLKAAVTWKE